MADDNDQETCFETDPGFCPDCGSILPLLGDKGGVTCYACKKNWGPEGIGGYNLTFITVFRLFK